MRKPQTRKVSIIILALFLFAINEYAQDSTSSYIPENLRDAHRELIRLLPDSVIAIIKNTNENDLINYHMGLGMWIRNNWGLWENSRLAQYFDSLGVEHPDDMSETIIETFWRYLNNKPDNLNKLVLESQEWQKAMQKYDEEEKERVKKVKEAIPQMMMGMKMKKDYIDTVAMASRSDKSLRNRYFSRFKDGVLLAVREMDYKTDKYFIIPYFLDLKQVKLHPVKVPEIDFIESVIVVDKKACISGFTNEVRKLIIIDSNSRYQQPLPDSLNYFQLGKDGNKIILIYQHSIFELDENKWKSIYKGVIDFPQSGIPPQKIHDKIYFRDEGHGEDDKQLWWFDLKTDSNLISFCENTALVGKEGPRWEDNYDYLVLPDGTLWIIAGSDISGYSLIQKSVDGNYKIAVFNGEIDWNGGELLGSDKDSTLAISGLCSSEDGSIFGVSRYGLYRLFDNAITQLIAFTNTSQEIVMTDGESTYSFEWDPSKLYVLGNQEYLISGEFDGIYLLNRDNSGKLRLISLDEEIGDAVIF